MSSCASVNVYCVTAGMLSKLFNFYFSNSHEAQQFRHVDWHECCVCYVSNFNSRYLRPHLLAKFEFTDGISHQYFFANAAKN